MWEPIVKDNKLYGLSLNPLGNKKPVRADYGHSELEYSTYVKHRNDWIKEESQRRLVEVDESEKVNFFKMVRIIQEGNFIKAELIPGKTFDADESEGKLINIKVINQL